MKVMTFPQITLVLPVNITDVFLNCQNFYFLLKLDANIHHMMQRWNVFFWGSGVEGQGHIHANKVLNPYSSRRQAVTSFVY